MVAVAGRFAAAAHAQDFLALRDEEVRHLDRLREVAAAIPAQVEDDALRAFADEPLQRRRDFRRRRLAELLHRDVRRLVVEHDRELDRGNADDAADERHGERIRQPARRNFAVTFVPGGPFRWAETESVFQRARLHVERVDEHDLVARHDAGFRTPACAGRP